MTDQPSDTFKGDSATMSMAHTARTYYLALIAEKFQPHEAIALTAAYTNSLLSAVASQPKDVA